MQPETRRTIVASFMELLGEQPWNAVTLESLAARSGVSLPALRGLYDTRFDIVVDFTRSMDEGVLDAVDPDMAREGARERLFDILFSRIEALNPHRAAIRNLARTARSDPGLALALNRAVSVSMSWMLAAAGIRATGRGGALRSQGLAIVWGRVLRTWLDEDDPGLPRTMAELDGQLRRSERVAVRLDRLERFFSGSARRSHRAPEPAPAAGGDLAEAHPS